MASPPKKYACLRMGSTIADQSAPLDVAAWSKSGDRINVKYDVPRRVNVAKLYPVQAPNGSSILIYGHESGLTCVWRGGQAVKNATSQPHQPRTAPSTTEPGNREVIIIDEDEDGDDGIEVGLHETLQTGVSEHPDGFDSQETEQDPLSPFDAILDVFSIPLSSPAWDIAFSPLPPNAHTQHGTRLPPVLLKNIVVAVACADSSIHMITLPLASPTSSRTVDFAPNQAKWGYQDTVLQKPASAACSVPNGIAMTWTAVPSTSRSLSPGAVPQRHQSEDRSYWVFLVAFHSIVRSGTLKIFGLTLHESETRFEPSPNLLITENLPYSTRSLYFHPSVYPSEKHCQILVSDTMGTIRIYEPRLYAGDNSLEPTENNAGPVLTRVRGSWLVTIHTQFEHHDSATAENIPFGENRTDILDAQWVFGGKGVIALLADGQWGIWYVAGSYQAQRNTGETRYPEQLFSGSGVTRFAIRGYLRRSEAGIHAGPARNTHEVSISSDGKKLAPLTPNARRAKQEALFTTTRTKDPPFEGQNTGGISLSSGFNEAYRGASDESLLIWFNSEVFSLPSVLSYWDHVAKVSDPGDRLRKQDCPETLFGPPLTRLHKFSPSGEIIRSVSHVRFQSRSSLNASEVLKDDIVICADYSIVVSSSTTMQRRPGDSLGSLFHAPRPLYKEQIPLKNSRTGRADRDGLDLVAMDEALDSMAREPRYRP